jgi:hypothetical protein
VNVFVTAAAAVVLIKGNIFLRKGIPVIFIIYKK